MPISFPANPSSGQEYTFSDITWRYNGYAWEKLDAGITFAQASGSTGYIQYNDGYGGFTSNANFIFDGTNVLLTQPVHLDGDILGAVHHLCHNTSGSSITRGTPVYITGTDGASTILRIAAADAANSSKMPAVGVAESTIASGDFGHIVIIGTLLQLNTSGFTAGDTIYVASGGGLTNVKPTGANVLIQNLGKVGRSHVNTGSVIILGPGRSNDVPNIVPIRAYAELPGGFTFNTVVASLGGLTGHISFSQIDIDGGTY